MKILFLSLFLSLLANKAFAQNTEGTIHYKETMRLDSILDVLKNLPEEVKAQIPKEQSFESVLTFHPTASLYTKASKDKNEDVNYKSKDEAVQVKFQAENPERAYFYDIPKRASIESREFLGKKFLVSNNKPKKWKIGKDTKEILGYVCKKATTSSEDGGLVEAWFTSSIPVEIGPGGFHGLPGTILSVRTKDGNYTIEATKVDFKKVDRTAVVPPKKGKKVRLSQFKEIVEAKQKEMAEQYGGNGNVIKTERIER